MLQWHYINSITSQVLTKPYQFSSLSTSLSSYHSWVRSVPTYRLSPTWDLQTNLVPRSRNLKSLGKPAAVKTRFEMGNMNLDSHLHLYYFLWYLPSYLTSLNLRLLIYEIVTGMSTRELAKTNSDYSTIVPVISSFCDNPKLPPWLNSPVQGTCPHSSLSSLIVWAYTG